VYLIIRILTSSFNILIIFRSKFAEKVLQRKAANMEELLKDCSIASGQDRKTANSYGSTAKNAAEKNLIFARFFKTHACNGHPSPGKIW
jgi:hypothetical protein